MKKENKIWVPVILIFWQLLIWFIFVPTDYSNSYTDPILGPNADLAPGFYYILGMPAGLLGIYLSFSIFRKKLEITKSQKIIAWVLMAVSVCTAIPPLFLIVRYIFYPLANWLDQLGG